MIKSFHIMRDDQSIGRAEVEKTGLYYRIVCSCRLDRDHIYKIIARGDMGSENLGICVPRNGGFGLTVRIPVKRLGTDNLSFAAVIKQTCSENAYSLDTSKPFHGIERLINGRYAVVNNIPSVMIKDQSADLQDNDPNPEYPRI